MNHARFVRLAIKEVPVVILALVVHLTGNDDAIVIDAVFGNDLNASPVGFGDDVFNGMHVTHRRMYGHVYGSLLINVCEWCWFAHAMMYIL